MQKQVKEKVLPKNVNNVLPRNALLTVLKCFIKSFGRRHLNCEVFSIKCTK